MSNLNLPSLAYKSLLDSLVPDKSKTLGYATTARREESGDSNWDYVTVLHHGHAIATLAPFAVWITNQGHHTRTTADRLRKVLRDNGIPFTVATRKGVHMVLDSDFQPIAALTGGVVFRMVAGLWTLENVDIYL